MFSSVPRRRVLVFFERWRLERRRPAAVNRHCGVLNKPSRWRLIGRSQSGFALVIGACLIGKSHFPSGPQLQVFIKSRETSA